MTTNKERAVEVMRNFWHDGRYAVGFDEIADGLADVGLLTPDLPERDRAMFPPEGSVWYPHLRFAGDIRASANGNVVIMGIDTSDPDGTGDPYRIVGTADEVDTFARYLAAAAAAARTHQEKK